MKPVALLRTSDLIICYEEASCDFTFYYLSGLLPPSHASLKPPNPATCRLINLSLLPYFPTRCPRRQPGEI